MSEARVKNITKKSFSLLEILIVLGLILSLGGVFSLKSGAFIDKSLSKMQINGVLEALNKAYFYSQVCKKQVVVDIFPGDVGLTLKIDTFSYKKSFSKLSLEGKKYELELMPESEDGFKTLNLSYLGKSAQIVFSQESKKFLMEVK